MKYSTLQEQKYGVALLGNPLSSERNETMLAGTNVIESKNNGPLEKGSIVSHLPLLFANGHPTSLEKITLAQLERFVTFMIQCSLGHETTEVASEPQWWPKEVKFSHPITRPKRVNDNWMANLKKLVFRCYTYHRSEYLLRFCSFLARYPQEELEYVKNWDSTISLYHKSTSKLLVTFRNENMNYDRRLEGPHKKLLSCTGITSCYSNKSKQQQHSDATVEQPAEDIYLCDNCDAEFVGLDKMKEHERICCEQEHSGNNSRSTTPDVPLTEPEVRQDQFLEYFHLCSMKSELKSIDENKGGMINNNNSKNTTTKGTSRRVRGSISFTRCPTIPFSSPAGILLAKKSKAMTDETQQERLERIERHLIAPVLNSSFRPKWLEAEVDNDRWIVTHKANREKPVCDYVHQYKFVNSVKRKPMLSIQSQLLYVVCRPVYVLLTRLTSEQINDLKRDLPKYRCLVRNVSVDNKEIAMESEETLRSNVSSKRKAPSDDNDTRTMEENKEVDNNNVESIKHSTVFEGENSCDRNDATDVELIGEGTVHSKPSSSVMVIDLCSSDEENLCTAASVDDNRNTINCMTEEVTKSLLQTLSSAKFHLKPHICLTERNDEWPSDNILPENCTNGYHSTMLSTRTTLPPILRPAP